MDKFVAVDNVLDFCEPPLPPAASLSSDSADELAQLHCAPTIYRQPEALDPAAPAGLFYAALDKQPAPTRALLHNDMSHNELLHSASSDSSFDELLNQPGLVPGQHYAALPSYVHPAALDALDAAAQPAGVASHSQLMIGADDPFGGALMTSSTESTARFSVDELLIAKPEEFEEKKEHSAPPPKYQNILLPIKLDTCNPDKSSKTTANELAQDLQFPDLMANGNQTSVSNNPVKNILEEPEHVYENVYIGTDIPKAQEANAAINKIRTVDPGSKHTYENVNFETQSINTAQRNEDGVYECIYISDREHIPETNTELEIAAKKMIEQLNLKESEIQVGCSSLNVSSASANPSSSTKLVFQNIQLDNPSIQIQETKTTVPPVGFTTIDDMSEEELSKYLANLEAEERAKERAAVVYENISVDSVAENLMSKPIKQEDEDANEAPIFEAVTIGELPQVPQEDLQEKAKKFPVIDYSKGSTSGETSREFLCSKKAENSCKVSTQVREEESRSKKSKKTHEKVRKSSDNLEPVSQNSSHQNEEENIVKDEENGNYVPASDTDDNQSRLDAHNLESEHNENFNCNESSTTFDKIDNKDIVNNEQNVNNTTHDDKSYSRSSATRTETISRFSVTRNVDVNDKLGGRSRPSQSHSRTKRTEHNAQNIESSDEDPNRPSRPQTLNVVPAVDMLGASYNQETSDAEGDKDSGRAPSPDVSENSSMESSTVLGKQPPFWVPDSDAPNCMLCDIKFTVMKRRHHCRACGKVLCNKCCNMRYRLEYQNNVDSRVCIPCHQVLTKAESDNGSGDYTGFSNTSSAGINSPQGRQPNPNNPMEYCSTIPPLQQLAGGLPPPPTVMVPVGVLKREGSTKPRSDGPKSVMFSDGIRPGCDLTELDTTWDWNPVAVRKMTPRQGFSKPNCPPRDAATNSFIPSDPSSLPPTVTIHKGQATYHEVSDLNSLYASLKNECEPPVMFAINRNLFACVKIINLNCCVNRICWNVTSKGLACVGQDEVVFLIETLPDENEVPKDLLLHINQIYHEAKKGNSISEYSMSIHQSGNLLGSREHAGFLFIRQTLQCLQKVIVPPAPFLVGLLVHRWETPWAKVFPLRLVLRLGAEYRYYPCPLVSVRFRDAVYFEIGHTIMKVLADFRNFAYTLPKVQGLTIHMEDKTTYVRFPENRYHQVIKGLNNSNDHVLAFASNFSIQADSHLVCIQTNSEDESTYQTQAINIQNRPRKVTGASFIVINGALKSSMGLSANSSILEDGLMVQIMPEKMEALKAALKNMKDFTIGCGRQGAPEPDEIVNIKWVANDTQFNLGIKSPIDGKPMDGIPSIRVHSGTDFTGQHRFIRWTEVFIIKADNYQSYSVHCPVDINKLAESIARATCAALVKLLDLLANAGLTKIAVRTTISPENVGYEAGSEGTRLPPIYMNSLDNEIIQVLQKAVQGCEDSQTVLELIFYVLETE